MAKNSNLLKQLATSKVASLNKDVLQVVRQEKQNKFRNEKVVIDGEVIDSKKEAKRYGELKMLLKSNEIVFLARQVEFTFHIEGEKLASYFADFVYSFRKSPNILEVEDVKSFATRTLSTYRLKKKAMWLQNRIHIKER